MENNKKISKRQFLKYLGSGSVAFVLAPVFCALPFEPGSFLSHNSGSGSFDIQKWKWKKLAKYFTPLPNAVRCDLCPNLCRLQEDNFGICRTRYRYKNDLWTIAYGNPCSMQIDPIEKKPFSHFLPSTTAFSIATAGCSLACLNCQNWTISQTSPADTRNFDLPPEKVVEQAMENKCKSIAYTYSEPTVFYEYMLDTAILAHKKGIKNVIKTSGYINEKPLRELIVHIDGANVDLKSFSNDIYQNLNAGLLDPVLNTLKVLKEQKVWLEITNLVIPSWTDDLEMIRQMCQWLVQNGFSDTPLHFSRFSPTHKLTNLPPTPVETLLKAKQIAVTAGLLYVYIGNVPSLDEENTFCPKCKKMLVERSGFIVKQNHIKDCKCGYCNFTISGVFE